MHASNSHTPWDVFGPAEYMAASMCLAIIKIIYKDLIIPKTKFYQMVKNLSLGRTDKCKKNIANSIEVTMTF
jgi:hypothetical protein